jgi:hypothetical protein
MASGPNPRFELRDEYEAPLLNLQLDNIKAVFGQKNNHRRIHYPPNTSESTFKVVYE